MKSKNTIVAKALNAKAKNASPEAMKQSDDMVKEYEKTEIAKHKARVRKAVEDAVDSFIYRINSVKRGLAVEVRWLEGNPSKVPEKAKALKSLADIMAYIDKVTVYTYHTPKI